MLKWLYLSIAVIALIVFGLLLNDLRLELKRTARTVNEQLPEILDKSRRSADALAAVSDDIRQLRDLAGAPAAGARDETLAAYADSVLDALEKSDLSIGLKPKLFGDALKDTQPAKEWVVAARKEGLWLTFRAKSKAELLDGLTKNKFGSDWYAQPPAGGEAVPLRDWLKANHPESRDVQ